MCLLNVIVAFNPNLHSKNNLTVTLDSIPKVDFIKTIVISPQKLDLQDYRNTTCLVANYKNIYSAYNQAMVKISEGYVLYLIPGDEFISGSVNLIEDLAHSNFNIIQYNHDRKKQNNEVYHLTRLDASHNTVFNGIFNMPNNLNCVYDKLYRVDFLRYNNLKFKNHKDAALIFNYSCLDKDAFIYKKDKMITHLVGTDIGVLSDVCRVENTLLKELLETSKPMLQKSVLDIWNKNVEYYKNIDFVFPYVTSDDINWQQLYKNALTGSESDWAAGVERFRDNGMLKYVFRSIETHMPWINKVHMIVMSDSQVPRWINRNTVDIITHDEFMPKELLPTFNSCTIDMFLSRLPRVSNNFIFSNDDLITFKDLPSTYFFHGSTPVYNINLRNYKTTAPGDITRQNVYNLILNTNQSGRVVTTQHGTVSYRKDWIQECFEKYQKEIINSCSKFREPKNYNQYLYAFYQMFEKTILNDSKDIISYTVKSSQVNKIFEDEFESHDFICINDDNSAIKDVWDEIIKKIDRLLPNKSKYEL